MNKKKYGGRIKMSSMLEDWDNGLVQIRWDGAVGWVMKNGQFRPLMSDALAELKEAGHIDDATVERTNVARDVYTDITLEAYRKGQAQRTPEEIEEERAEARSAMGPGVKMVNIITGEKYTT